METYVKWKNPFFWWKLKNISIDSTQLFNLYNSLCDKNTYLSKYIDKTYNEIFFEEQTTKWMFLCKSGPYSNTLAEFFKSSNISNQSARNTNEG